MNKKAIVILGAIFLLIVGTLGFLIYTKYGGKKAVSPPVSQGSGQAPATGTSTLTGTAVAPTATTSPSSSSSGSKFVKLLNTQVVSPVLFYNGQGVTYFDASGQLYRADFQQSGSQLQAGTPQSLGIQTRTDITKILWPAAGDNFIAQTSTNAGQKSWSFFNSVSRTYTDLPSQVESLDWLPSGQQIYYVWLDNGKATLNVSNPDTSNWKYIADMWETDDNISVSPDGKNILYYEQNTSTTTNPINLVTPDGKMWRTLVSTGDNYGVLWSPDSQKFVFGRLSTTGSYELWYYNLLTGQTTDLTLPTTIDKVAWNGDSQTLYAAVPVSGVAGGSSLTTDTFYKLDTSSLNKQQYDPGTTVIDGRNLSLSSDGSKLFFKNAQDGDLYYLDLSQ